MKLLLSLVVVLAALLFAAGARADVDTATRYYLSLGTPSRRATSRSVGRGRRSAPRVITRDTPTSC